MNHAFYVSCYAFCYGFCPFSYCLVQEQVALQGREWQPLAAGVLEILARLPLLSGPQPLLGEQRPPLQV